MYVSNLKSEAALRTEYDEEVGLSEEIKAEKEDKEVKIWWPTVAEIILRNFSLRYREELPLVLKNIGLKIEAGQKIGIVGRTGAGKSSIIHAIFRLSEPEMNS